MLEAELALAAEDFPARAQGARRSRRDRPDDPEPRADGGDRARQGASEEVVRGWLAKALGASRGPQWVCDKCNHVHATWAPVCENCGAFDTLDWRKTQPHARTPPRRLGDAAADRRRRRQPRRRAGPEPAPAPDPAPAADGRGRPSSALACRHRRRRARQRGRSGAGRGRRLTPPTPPRASGGAAPLTRCYDRSVISRSVGGVSRDASGSGIEVGRWGWRRCGSGRWRSAGRTRRGSIRSRCLPNRRQFQADAMLWGNGQARPSCSSPSPTPQAFNEILRVLGHDRSEAFIRAGAERLRDILGPGTAIYHVNLLGFAFRLPGHAEPDAPAMIDRHRRGLSRADPSATTCRSTPASASASRRLGPRRRQPGGGPARDARRPRRTAAATRNALGLVRPQAATTRTGAPSACSRTSSTALDGEGQLDAALPAQGRSSASGACDSAEALLRWTHPQLGPVSPGEFVDARRDHGAGHADDPLGDRRRDPAGGDLGSATGSTLASRSTSRRRTSRSRTSSSTCCSAARRADSTAAGSSSR